MSLNYEEIASAAREAEALLIGKEVTSCFEWGSKRLMVQFGGAGLFFCFEEPFLRLHYSEKRGGASPASPFGQALQKTLVGYTLETLSSIMGERVVIGKFTHKKSGRSGSLVLELFEKRCNGYLLDETGAITAAYQGDGRDAYSLPQRQSPPAVTMRFKGSAAIERAYEESERSHRLEREKQRLARLVALQVKRFNKRIADCCADLKKAEGWQSCRHEAELIQANLYRITAGDKSIEVDDWDSGESRLITLDATVTAAKEAAERFRKSKKLQRALPHLEKLIKEAEEALKQWKLRSSELDGCNSQDELASFSRRYGLDEQRHEKKKKGQERLPYKRFITAYGGEILVGKNARDNDALTFGHARGNDWWLHAHNYSGSHVILKVARGREPQEEEILDAAQLALAYSKGADRGGAEIIVTQKKYLSRQGQSKAGQVAVSKHKKRHIVADPERLEEIKKRKTNLL